MPSIALWVPSQATLPEPFDSSFRDHGFEITRTDDPEVVERLSEEGVDAVLLCTDEPGSGAVLDFASRLCRQHGAPVVLAGGELTGERFLELFTVGVVDHVPGRARPDVLAARLFAAIERQQTGRELRRGYAAFRKLFGESLSPMAIAGADGRLVDANGAFLDMVGRSLGELREIDVTRLTHEEDETTLRLFEELVRGERDGYVAQKRLVASDGSVVWVRISASRLVEPITGAIHVIADIENLTPAVESDRALDTMRNRYRALFEQVPSAILVLDLETMRFTEVNQAAEDLFGYPRTELLSLGVADLWHGTQAEPLDAFLRDDRRIGPMRQQLRRKDGAKIETDVTLTPPDGERSTRMLLIRNVTDVRDLEQALDRSRKKLALDHQPTSLLHDLANLLTVLLDRYEHLVEVLPREPDVLHRAQEVQHLGDRVVELIRTFLANTRATPSLPKPLDMSEAVSQATRLIQALLGDGIELVVERSDEPLPIWFDKTDLDQILLNLTTNARDAMQGRGRLTVTTGRSPASNPHGGSFARLSVRDTGPGIGPELAEMVFKPHFTTKPTGSGSGIGLSNLDRLVRRSGGSIHLESAPGEGATFHVDLPLDADHVRRPARRRGARPSEGVNILLVDDDEAVCSLVREMLESAGHRVLSARGGREALRTAEHFTGALDLLIVDATLDDLETPELIARLRKKRRHLEVLIVSGYLDGVLMARGILGTDTPFLPKPFTARELLERVDEAVALRQT